MFKHLEKNCLGNIRCIIRIPEYPVCCVVNRPFVLADQLGHGPAVAAFTVVYKGSIPVLIHNYIPGREKLVQMYRFLLLSAPSPYLAGCGYDFEKLVETGIAENIMDVVVDVNQLNTAAGAHQSLMCFK